MVVMLPLIARWSYTSLRVLLRESHAPVKGFRAH